MSKTVSQTTSGERGQLKRKLLIACLLSLVVLVAGCNPSPGTSTSASLEREEIISFTQQALAVETEHDKLIVALLKEIAGFRTYTFLKGVLIPGWTEMTSAPELKNKLLLLNCPTCMQPIKDSLIEVYRLEIQAAQHDRGTECGPGLPPPHYQFYPRINHFNVGLVAPSYDESHSPWVIAQKLRRDTYIKWAEILEGHGIDPAKEGFYQLDMAGAR